jgi:hypothetical protein
LFVEDMAAIKNHTILLLAAVLLCLVMAFIFMGKHDSRRDAPAINVADGNVAVDIHAAGIIGVGAGTGIDGHLVNTGLPSASSSSAKGNKSPPVHQGGSLFAKPTAPSNAGKATSSSKNVNGTVVGVPVNPKFDNSIVNDFIIRIQQVIKSKRDIVGVHRFYSEHNLSFANSVSFVGQKTTNSTVASNASNALNASLYLKTITSLSEDGTPLHANQTSGVHSIAWARTWYKENYLVPKTGYAANFPELAKQVSKIKNFVESNGGQLPAIRYHTYTSHCKFIRSLGNASVLPIPVILTFKLNPDVGHYSSDSPGKTCIRSTSLDSHGVCKEMISMVGYLKRCKQKVESLIETINNPKLLLLVTNQQQTFQHNKVLSLPIGVTGPVASQICILLSEIKTAMERPVFIAISNFNGYYSSKVIAHYSRFFHITASLDYDKHNQVEGANVMDYLEKLSMSKFVLCPPGNLICN